MVGAVVVRARATGTHVPGVLGRGCRACARTVTADAYGSGFVDVGLYWTLAWAWLRVGWVRGGGELVRSRRELGVRPARLRTCRRP